ncbi:MAG: aldehyde dehydrogenase family protein [Planctomycetota bacterium]
MSPLPPELDADLRTLSSRKDAWAALDVRERIPLLDRVVSDLLRVSDRWVAASLRAKSLDPDSPVAGEEWFNLAILFRQLRMFRRSLSEIASLGRPLVPGPVSCLPDGSLVLRLFPRSPLDRALYPGITGEAWMEPGVSLEDLPDLQARAYSDKSPTGRLALVLGAGNQPSPLLADLLQKLLVENSVVLLKMNPTNDYLAPLIEEAFRALIDPGFLRVALGDASVGESFVRHPASDSVHVTGSVRTYESILFGSGPEGEMRKIRRQPILDKPLTAELGNLTPFIILPGNWSSRDLARAAEHLAGALTQNVGFNCLTPRVILTSARWPLRKNLLDALRSVLSRVPTRVAYYPGAPDRHSAFLAAHPEAELFGDSSDGRLPWTLIPGVPPDNPSDICFTTEPFCSLFSETPIDAPDDVAFLDRACRFANENLWGTLSATLIAHPRSLRDPALADAVEHALADLRYGTVGLNVWGGLSYTFALAPTGAYPPGDSPVQSGVGFVNNPFMIERVRKSVFRGPFRQPVKPSALMKNFHRLARRLALLEARPSPLSFVRLLLSAARSF